MAKLTSLLFFLAALSIFLPYFMPFALETDVQPACLIFCTISLIFINRLFIGKIGWIIIFYSLFSILNLRLTSFSHVDELIIVVFSYISIVIIYIFGRNVDSDFVFKALKTSFFVYVFGAVVQIVSPSLYSSVLSYFYNQKVIFVGIRGWSSFAPEPTDLGFTLGILLLCYFVMSVNSQFQKSQKNSTIYYYIGGFLILGSLSVSGLVIGLWLVFSANILGFFSKTKTFLAGAFALGVVFLYGVSISDFRSVSLFLNLFLNPMFVVENSSLFYRVFQNHLAFAYSFENYFLPSGINTFMVSVTGGVDQNIFYSMYPSRAEYIRDFFNTPPSGVKNVIARWTVENGFVAFIFIFFLTLRSFTSLNRKYYLVFFGCFALYLFQSFPLFYPPIWFLMGVMERQRAIFHRSITGASLG